MEGFTYVDLFATKGVEYLLVIGFLLVLIPFWRLLRAPARAGFEAVRRAIPSLTQWFQLPEGLYYHQGHSWVMPQGADLVKVGVDDFAQKLVGRPNKIDLPQVGSRIEQGEVGWKLGVDSKTIDMLSPVTGEIVAVNKDVLKNPDLINQDPYGKGWLAMVKPHNIYANVKNLLTGRLATAWMEATADTLRQRMGGELGVVYQDGGLPVAGIARVLSPEEWDKLAGEFLLTKE
ncbi:MAG: glycine cleavage system protein H [Deltaproteobacteria bacterium]|nr:MAG: glycine cleavage system protein H [Deltaproteobacteria bacterium]